MRVAFYAPMKPPTSVRPSGDRTIARLLMRALERAGCEVRLASEFRSWSPSPDPEVLSRTVQSAKVEADAVSSAWRRVGWRPDIWFTYHLYYKAPDLIGPGIAAELGIPYVVAEASYSPRRVRGPWAEWQQAAAQGIRAADLILCFTERDRRGLAEIASNDRFELFAPFLDLAEASLARRNRSEAGDPVKLVTVAMMRDGSKLRSYRFLASALSRLATANATGAPAASNWSLTVVGDGPAAQDVYAAFDSDEIVRSRTAFLGQLQPSQIAGELARSDLFVWPGFEEAFGMAYLEAQAQRLPVLALDTAGVASVVRDGVSGRLVATADEQAFANALAELTLDRQTLQNLGERAHNYVVEHHGLAAAAERLRTALWNVNRQRDLRS